MAQTIPNVQALVVTTPQAVALADVRKSINFCKTVEMPIIGVVENMSGFICPHCQKTVDIFSSGGGEKTARDFELPFLGKVPMDPRVVIGGDSGQPYLSSDENSPAVQAFAAVVEAVERRLPVKREEIKPAGGLKMATALQNVAESSCGCGCGDGGCDPDKCDC